MNRQHAIAECSAIVALYGITPEELGEQAPASEEVRFVVPSLVESCANARQALSLCIRMSGFTDERVAQLIGISKGYLSKVLNGRASLDGDRRIRLMRSCGNLAPAQFEAQQFGLHLGQRDPQDVLREALTLIEQRRAAA